MPEETHFSFFLFGVYGIDKQMIYIHGKELEDNRNKLFRNSLDIWIDENNGNSTHESKTTLIKLDYIEIKELFSGHLVSPEIKSKMIRKIGNKPNVKYITEEILEGRIYIGSGFYSTPQSMFDNTKFIEKVLTYLEKII